MATADTETEICFWSSINEMFLYCCALPLKRVQTSQKLLKSHALALRDKKGILAFSDSFLLVLLSFAIGTCALHPPFIINMAPCPKHHMRAKLKKKKI